MRGVTSPGSFLSSLALLVFALLNAACSMAARPQPVTGNLVIHVERSAGVPEGSVVFKPMPGRLLGKAADIELFESATGDDRFQLPVAHLQRALHSNAAITRSDAANPGELTQPRDLRMARVATFFESRNDSAVCSNFRTGLRSEWPAQATLVYVDRAGSVRGTRYTSPYILEYDLEFPVAGLYVINSVSHAGHLMQTVTTPGSLVAQVKLVPCARSESTRQVAR